MNKTGCEYGRTNRIYIDEINAKLTKIVENTNHFSQRLPNWAVAIIGFMASLITGLIVRAVS